MTIFEFWAQWFLALTNCWYWFGGIVTIPVFKQETLRCKNWCFCYLYMENLFFIWFWWGFLMNSLGNFISEKFIALSCNYYCFWHERTQKEKISNFMQIHLYMHLNGLLMDHNFCFVFYFSVLEMNILIYWSESNSWIYFYI